jgi:ankyrin repeat protein
MSMQMFRKYITALKTKDQIMELFATFSEDELHNITTEIVLQKYPNMLEVLKIAIRFGFNINNMNNTKTDHLRLIDVAIEDNNLDLFLLSIKEKTDLSTVDGQSLLHSAVLNENIFAIKYLCKKVDIDEKNDESYTSLDLACISKNETMVDILLQNNATDANSGSDMLLNELIEFYKIKAIGPNFLEEPEYLENENVKTMLANMDTNEKILVKLIDHKVIEETILIKYISSMMLFSNTLILKNIIDKYPELLKENFIFGKSSMLAHAITLNYEEIIVYILNKLNKCDLEQDICNNGETCLHKACYIANTEIIDLILKKCDTLINVLDNDNRTAIDYILMEQLIPSDFKLVPPKTKEQIIEIIRKLVNHKCNINNKNTYNASPLMLAIQYCDEDIVKELINLGASTKIKNYKEALQKSKIWLPLMNNDFIGYAIQCDKLNILKLLVENKVPLLFIKRNIKNTIYKIYTALLLSIMHMRTEILEYLLKVKEIKKTINEDTKEYLLRQAVLNGCTDIKIFQMFKPNDTNLQEFISITKTTLDKKRCDKYFERYYPKYIDKDFEQRIIILENTYMVLDILCSAKTIYVASFDKKAFRRNSSGEFSKYVNRLFSKMDNFLDAVNNIHGSEMVSIFNVLVSRTFMMRQLFINLFYGILHLYHYRNTSENTKNKKQKNIDPELLSAVTSRMDEDATAYNIIICIENMIKDTRKLNILEEFPSFIKNILDLNEKENEIESNDSNESKESNESNESEKEKSDEDLLERTIIELKKDKPTGEKKFNNISKNTITNHHSIRHKLSKLLWPFRVSHYNFLFNLLKTSKHQFNIINHIDNVCMSMTIASTDSVNKIEYQVMKLKTQKSQRWFEYYGKNIAMNGKVDDYHMFPFVFDDKLKNHPCIVKRIEDPTDPDNNGFNTLVYFYGRMIFQNTNETVVGCYEYFINSRATLFHRIFKPLRKIPNDIVSEIMKECIM